MERFHFNPETGATGKCSAKVQCRFGLTEEAHYESAGEARRAFEETQELPPPLQKPLGPPPDLSSAALLASLQAEGKLPLASSPQKPPGAILEKETSVAEKLLQDPKALKALGDSLLKLPLDSREELLGGGFVPIGEGIQRRAFLSGEEGVVFKVPLGKKSLMKKISAEEEASLKLLPQEEMAARGILYAPTAFVSGRGGVPLVAQEYQDPVYVVSAEDHITDEQFAYLDELASNQETTGFTDFTFENVRYDLRTGNLVVIDCLYSKTASEEL